MLDRRSLFKSVAGLALGPSASAVAASPEADRFSLVRQIVAALERDGYRPFLINDSLYIRAEDQPWDRPDERLALLRAVNRETVIEYLRLTGGGERTGPEGRVSRLPLIE